MIKAIIFDFGGVFDPKHESLQGFAAAATHLGIDPAALYDLLYAGEAWQQAKLGQISDRAYLCQIMQQLDPSATDVDHFRAWLFAGHQLDPAVTVLAQRLAAHYPLALLSNATDALESILAQAELDQLFQVVINSARVGVAKPDPRSFALTLEALGVAAHEVVFIDDKPRNIRAAEALGIASILFVDAAQLEHELQVRGLLAAVPA